MYFQKQNKNASYDSFVYWEKDAFRSLGYGSVLLSREQVCAAQVPWWLGVAQIHKDICGIVVASVFLSSHDLKQQFSSTSELLKK